MKNTYLYLALGYAVLAATPLFSQSDSTADSSTAKVRSGLVTREELIHDRLRRLGVVNPDPAPRSPATRAERIEWERHKRAAAGLRGQRIVISIYDRRLWLINGNDTILSTSAGVGMGAVRMNGKSYDFSTPRGPRTVVAKQRDPKWNPPAWHYEGMARTIRPFPATGIRLEDGRRVVHRGDKVGYLSKEGFTPIPPERNLIFNGIGYIPPYGTLNRQIPDVLGKYKLDMAEGILIHGTNDPLAIGFPATHGCIRLSEEPLERLFELAQVGTRVYIY